MRTSTVTAISYSSTEDSTEDSHEKTSARCSVADYIKDHMVMSHDDREMMIGLFASSTSFSSEKESKWLAVIALMLHWTWSAGYCFDVKALQIAKDTLTSSPSFDATPKVGVVSRCFRAMF